MITAEEFAEVSQQHRRSLLSAAFRMLRNADDAEDAVQEGLALAWRRRDTFEGRSTLRSWVHSIVLNTCRDVIRRRAVRGYGCHVCVLDVILPEPSKSAELSILDNELRELVKLGVGLSPKEQWLVRETLEGRDLPNKPEIRLIRFRAVRKLRKYFKEAA